MAKRKIKLAVPTPDATLIAAAIIVAGSKHAQARTPERNMTDLVNVATAMQRAYVVARSRLASGVAEADE